MDLHLDSNNHDARELIIYYGCSKMPSSRHDINGYISLCLNRSFRPTTTIELVVPFQVNIPYTWISLYSPPDSRYETMTTNNDSKSLEAARLAISHQPKAIAHALSICKGIAKKSELFQNDSVLNKLLKILVT
jgi:hypothetical protein